jgi:hypothetical protein
MAFFGRNFITGIEKAIVMGQRFPEEKIMNKRCHTKTMRVGESVAEIEVEMIETGEGWSIYLSLEDAYKFEEDQVQMGIENSFI